MKLPSQLLACCIWGFTMATVQAQAPTPPLTPSQALHALFAEEWERGLRERPERASYQGDTRFNDRWTDMSLAAIEARLAADRAALERLRSIPRANLSAADQLHFDTFEWQLQLAVRRQAFKEHLQPIGHQGGVQTLNTILQTMPFSTALHYRQYLARLAGIPALVDQTLLLMQQGRQEGRMPPRVLMNRVPAQLAAQLVDDATQSPFYAPFKRLPATLPEAEGAALEAEARQLIQQAVVPAYRKLQLSFERDYLPHTRDTIAASAQPDGAAHYELLVKSYTTTALTAREIHNIGLQEVERLQVAMEKVKAQTGFTGSMEAFFTFLRTDGRFF